MSKIDRSIHRLKLELSEKTLSWRSKLYNILWLENPIVDWVLNKIVYPIQNFIDWIRKSIAYAIFLWPDRDWDWVSALELLKFKLQRIEKCIRTNDFIEGTSRITKQINYAIFLIDRITAGDFCYFPKEEKALEEKWGELKMETEKSKINKHHLSVRFYYTKPKTKEEQKIAKEEWFAFRVKQTKEYNKDLTRLFRHLEKYIQSWWD